MHPRTLPLEPGSYGSRMHEMYKLLAETTDPVKRFWLYNYSWKTDRKWEDLSEDELIELEQKQEALQEKLEHDRAEHYCEPDDDDEYWDLKYRKYEVSW